MIIEKLLEMGKKVKVEKAYDSIDWEAMWDVLKVVYGMGGGTKFCKSIV